MPELKQLILVRPQWDILLYTDGLSTCEVSHDISELGARLRAKYLIRTPDSIQLATGIIHGAKYFITNDIALKKVKEIEIIVLDDYK